METQCPICLKNLSSNQYLMKHIFDNKRKCTPPSGHNPPTIDYENRTWSGATETQISKKKQKKVVSEARDSVSDTRDSVSDTRSSVSEQIDAILGQPHLVSKTKDHVPKQDSQLPKVKPTYEIMEIAPKPRKPVLDVTHQRELALQARERQLQEREERLRRLEDQIRIKEKNTREIPTVRQNKPDRQDPQVNDHQSSSLHHSQPTKPTISSFTVPLSKENNTLSVKPKVEIIGQEEEDPNQNGNNYTISVDTEGNMIDLPHMKTNNDILRNNPVLQEQVKQVIKNLNLKKKDNFKLPPEIDRCQKGVEGALEDFCDMYQIIEMGLKHDINQVNTIVSINLTEDHEIHIEKIYIPDKFRHKTNRPISFVEILYRGIYHMLSKVIAQKYQFFELTRSSKAYDDVIALMKYRKLILVSHLVLKRRLDKLHATTSVSGNYENPSSEEESLSDMNKAPLQPMDPLLSRRLIAMHEAYYAKVQAKHFPYSRRFNNESLLKIIPIGKTNSIEAQSLNMFYENLSHYISLMEFHKIINPHCFSNDNQDHSDFNEEDMRKTPECRYINLESMSHEHNNFSDYNMEIKSRDFCSHLIKVTPMSFYNEHALQNPSCYYKRIYVDGSCEAPITEQEYEEFKQSY